MQQISIPLTGLVGNPKPPSQKIGSLKECTNWLKWRDMLIQPNGPVALATAANAHSAIWHRDDNSNAYLVYTDGRHIKKVDASNNAVTTITANEFAAANLTNFRWPIDRFYKHIFFGTDHDGLHWFFPAGYNGTYTGKAGVAAPANAATVAAGNAGGVTGVYKLVYTYVNAQGHESAPSPESSSICVYDQILAWSNIEVGPTGTTQRKLYRTVNDGALFLYVTTLDDNTTTAYNDTTSDTSLGAEVDFEGSDLPPACIRGMAVAGPRLYLLDNGSKIWASKITTDDALPNWESYPSKLATAIPAGESSDQVQNIFSLNEVIFAATRNRVFKLVGDPYTGTQVVKIANIGLFNRWSWCYVDSDRRYVYMLTSNYKVVRMDMEGNWQEVGDDIITYLQSITNYKASDLGDSVELAHDPRLNLITVHCATTGQVNHTTFVLDLTTGKWSQVDWGYKLSLVDDTSQKYIGYEAGSRFVTHDNNTYTKNGATYFTTQVFQTYPFYIPDKQLQVGRIGIRCRALPIQSYIPPMLYVEFAVNNNDRWIGKFVDVSNVPRRFGGTGNAQVSQEEITVFIPVHSTVDSISVRVSAPQNAAAIQGFEIYDIFLEVLEAEKVPAAGRDADRDKR